MDLFSVSKETKDEVRKKANMDEQRIKEGVKALKVWLNLQPHLPHDYDETRLETLLMRCKGSLEKSKQTLDMYFSLRTIIPEILCNRDPYEPWFKAVTSIRCYIPMPQLTEDYERVIIVTRLNDDPTSFNIYDMFKMIFMITDVRTMEDYNFADICVVDLKSITMAEAVKYTFPVVRKIELISLKGFSGRLKSAHFINAPSFIDSTMNLLKSFMKPKIAARILVHREGYESLLQHISPKILPKEYGGEAGSIHDHWDMWKKKLETYRDWFLEQENLKVDESKRPGKSFNASDLFGFEGSFRQLKVD